MESLEINNTTGVLIKGESITLQQDDWNDKSAVSIHLSRTELIELADKIKSLGGIKL